MAKFLKDQRVFQWRHRDGSNFDAIVATPNDGHTAVQRLDAVIVGLGCPHTLQQWGDVWQTEINLDLAKVDT